MARIAGIKPRRGTTAEWAAANAASPSRKLDAGELGYDSTTKDLVVGDGTTAFASLPRVGSGTYAPLTTRRAGSFVSLGDSITQGPDDFVTNMVQAQSWPNLAAMLSGQRFRLIRNAAIGGNNVQAMSARFAADVAAYSPSMVFICAGRNNAADTDLATYVGYMTTLLGQVAAIGASPILCTIPPTNTGALIKQRTSIYNGWLRKYASQKGIPLVDFYGLLADPTNGSYKSIYNSGDGVHPNAAGYLAMAQLVVSTLAPDMPPGAGVPFCADDVEQDNSILAGCFASATGTALPTGWSAGTSPTGSTYSYTTDAAVPGKLLTVTHSAASGVRQLVYALYMGNTTVTTLANAGASTLITAARADQSGVLFTPSEIVKILSSAGGGPQTQTLANPLLFAHPANEAIVANFLPGDEIIMSGVVISDGGVTWSIGTTFPSAAFSPTPANAIAGAGTFYWAQRIAVPAGSTGAMNLKLNVAAGTGVVKFGQIGIYNATRLGI